MSPHLIPAADLPALHALNQEHAVELSSLTPDAFAALIGRASFARAIGQGAFLIAFDHAAQYDSPNFRWFREAYDRFVYVDRIAVSAALRGRGLARILYDDLFEMARKAGHPRIVAEVNSDPPNPGSDAFHVALGFETVGEAHLEERGKTVRYIAREL